MNKTQEEEEGGDKSRRTRLEARVKEYSSSGCTVSSRGGRLEWKSFNKIKVKTCPRITEREILFVIGRRGRQRRRVECGDSLVVGGVWAHVVPLGPQLRRGCASNSNEQNFDRV